MAEVTTSAVREIGQARDDQGHRLDMGSDRDAVTIMVAGCIKVILDAGQREHFQKLFQQAEWAAEAWAKEHAGAGDG
jgi:hypothetical protein